MIVFFLWSLIPRFCFFNLLSGGWNLAIKSQTAVIFFLTFKGTVFFNEKLKQPARVQRFFSSQLCDVVVI